ncbi:TatD family hydrolase [Colwellia sp. D2M02]|uniref:TatD family hydrolase n=1 Tax=Colwellia sp. D2M02 TaxID=2841562 RepID=UPI001C07F497|nr:TatD family hydrolase [Colwellia sp. D2M02]MBU2894240.1 TatD family hydrolase [Colwellia sp. D2M02]
MKFTDSHCHLDDKVLTEQLPMLLTQCRQLAINRIIIPAILPANFDSVLALPKQYPKEKTQVSLYPCLGIHPWFLDKLTDIHLEQLANKVAQTRSDIIAIGETGLDGAIAKKAPEHGQSIEDNWAKQYQFFDFQLNLAKAEQLPVIIHHRQSHDKIVPRLKKYQLSKAGIIHGFSGSYQQAKSYLDLGFKLGIGGTITYPRAKKTINAIKRLPLESLVLETDAPSMPISIEAGGVIGQPNSPTYIVNVFQVLSEIRAESAEVIAMQLEKNLDDMFFSK